MPPSRLFFQPAKNYEEALHHAARRWGVQQEYWDIFGVRHVSPPEVERLILTSLGVNADSLESLNAAIEEQMWRQWASLVPPTLVQGEKEPSIQIHVAEPQAGDLVTADLEWENGGSHASRFSLDDLPLDGEAELRGVRFVRKILPLPLKRPLGYHKLRVRILRGGGEEAGAEARLIVCPDRAYQTPGWRPEGRPRVWR
jgi:hypothetical protein